MGWWGYCWDCRPLGSARTVPSGSSITTVGSCRRCSSSCVEITGNSLESAGPSSWLESACGSGGTDFPKVGGSFISGGENGDADLVSCSSLNAASGDLPWVVGRPFRLILLSGASTWRHPETLCPRMHRSQAYLIPLMSTITYSAVHDKPRCKEIARLRVYSRSAITN